MTNHNRQQKRHQRHLAAVRIIAAPSYPYHTAGGVIYSATVTDHNAVQNCRLCQYFDECAPRVLSGGYAMCEQIIASEIIPDAVIAQLEVDHV